MAGPNPHAELWALIEQMGPTEVETLVLRLKKHNAPTLTKISDLVEAASTRKDASLAIDAATAEVAKQPTKEAASEAEVLGG